MASLSQMMDLTAAIRQLAEVCAVHDLPLKSVTIGSGDALVVFHFGGDTINVRAPAELFPTPMGVVTDG